MLLSMIRKIGEYPEQYVRQPGRDFTRPRTLTFETVISLLLTMSENSIYDVAEGSEVIRALIFTVHTVIDSKKADAHRPSTVL